MLKAAARRLLELTGYELHNPVRAYASKRTLKGLLKQESINVVLDVGANTGGFVEGLRETGYAGRVISYEPLPSPHSLLTKRASGDPTWVVERRTAIGAKNGIIEMHVSANSESSSILPLLDSHTDASPSSTYLSAESVPIARLDDIWQCSALDRVLLKIDVQGYESWVLDGAQNVLANCRALIIEMSLVPLYSGQALALELWERLEKAGFDMWSLEPVFRDSASGRLLQIDGLFVKRSNGARHE